MKPPHCPEVREHLHQVGVLAPARDVAIRELTSRAGQQLGVGTVDVIADYYRLPLADACVAVADLVDAGELRRVAVLPVLIGADLVGRVDLKCDRKAATLRVQSSRIEEAWAPRAAELAQRLAPVLRSAARCGTPDLNPARPGKRR